MFYWVSLRTLYPRLLEEGSEMQKCLRDKGVSEREFRTRGRGGGPVPEAENLFLTSKFWLILAQIGQIKTIQNPLELENV